MKLSSIVKSFKDARILVVGDLMLDTYLWGKSSRISPEAPVPVVDIREKEDRLGGAANVALNLTSLGCKTFLCSVCGDDKLKPVLFELLQNSKISSEYIITDAERPTTQKTRIISHNKHIVRFDHELTEDIQSSVSQSVLSQIKLLMSMEKLDAIVLQDYNKGLLTPQLIESLIAMANAENVFISVDPKRRNFFSYKNVGLFKPNLVEVRDALMTEVNPEDENSLVTACEFLEDKLYCENVLLTLSDKGIFYHQKEGNSGHISAHHRNIVDVSGAGDTVISVATASMAVEKDLSKAAYLSNLAGGLACERVGVVPISNSELMDALRQENEEEIRVII